MCVPYTFTANNNQQVDCGFKPSIIVISTSTMVVYVNTNEDSEKQYVYSNYVSGALTTYNLEYGANTLGLICGINDNGFTCGHNKSTNVFIVAIK